MLNSPNKGTQSICILKPSALIGNVHKCRTHPGWCARPDAKFPAPFLKACFGNLDLVVSRAQSIFCQRRRTDKSTIDINVGFGRLRFYRNGAEFFARSIRRQATGSRRSVLDDDIGPRLELGTCALRIAGAQAHEVDFRPGKIAQDIGRLAVAGADYLDLLFLAAAEPLCFVESLCFDGSQPGESGGRLPRYHKGIRANGNYPRILRAADRNQHRQQKTKTLSHTTPVSDQLPHLKVGPNDSATCRTPVFSPPWRARAPASSWPTTLHCRPC